MNHLIADQHAYNSGAKSWKAKCGVVVDDWANIWSQHILRPMCKVCLVLAALEVESE